MKIIINILSLLLIVVILFSIVCFWDTNSIVYDFKKTVREQNFTNTALDRYIGNYDEEKGPILTSKVKIHRKFLAHNFSKGILYVKYSYAHYNADGEIIGGSWNIPSKWFIEKKSGRWIVKKIEEKP